MASTGSALNSVSQKCGDLSKVFEENVRDRLGWSKKKWETVGEEEERLHTLCNSMNYWSKKLKPAFEKTSLVVTLFSYDRDIRVNFMELVDGLLALGEKAELIGFTELRNPRYVCFYFKDEEAKTYAETNFRKLNDSYVVFLSWALGLQEKKVKVHWVAMTLDINTIRKQLEPYFVFKDYRQEELILMNGKKLRSGKCSFKVNMKDGVSAEDVPHLMIIGGLEALITIQGRAPLCLTCDKIGHIARECPTPFCVRCRSLKNRKHECDVTKGISYANAVSGKQIAAEFDDWESKGVDKPEKIHTSKLMLDDTEAAVVVAETPSVIGKQNSNVKTIIHGKKSVDKEKMNKQAKPLIQKNQESIDGVKNITDDIFVWTDGLSSDDDGKEEVDLDFSQSEVVRNMELYLKELNACKIGEAVGRGEEGEVKLDKVNDVNLINMEVDNKAVKRKSKDSGGRTSKGVPTREAESGWVKCYGRGGGGRSRRPKNRNSNKVFPASKEEVGREFVFTD